MRVGLLADAHANARALEAVLRQAARLGISRFLFAGDCVGYYYEPAETLRLLARIEATTVRGNHEDLLGEILADPERAEAVHAQYGSGLAVANASLMPGERAALLEWPAQRRIALGGRTILLCHGAPWDPAEYVYPDAPDAVFKRFADLDVDYVVLGHTHYRMVRRAGRVVVVNPGAVGQPRDRRPGAAWAVLDLDTGDVEHRTEPYDISTVAAAARARDPHLPYLSNVLLRT